MKDGFGPGPATGGVFLCKKHFDVQYMQPIFAVLKKGPFV